ncbi:Cuticle protein 1 [Papilio machaon]|uniref:Cuticle protein 1 n=1 Tax=Papilio machaon TaxID=76193 RepID=A0A194R001_PAPMA|nr:Cuticle protein 1 [Papilio machaon]
MRQLNELGLIAFVAVLGYASAGLIAPLVYGANAGDLQAAAIDATVAAQDNARAIGESQARAAEAVIQHNTEAVRQVAETNRDLHENAYWGSLAASQNLVAAAQSQAAAINGIAAARAAHLAPIAPLAYAGYGYGAHGLVAPYGLGLRAW